MATPNRTQLLNKLQKVLKQHYKPVSPDTARPVLEQVLFACCLENAAYDLAEKAFSRLGENYFDLNEVRVTTVAELAETLSPLPDPPRAALSLRRALQSIFESTYSFSLEHARKHSIAHGIKTLESLKGIPPFVVSHVVSTGLGGHTIPLDDGALAVLWLTGLITDEEYDARSVPWIDRAIPKKAGREFSSLLHQFGADLMRNVHSPAVRKMILAVDPAAKDRLPKRGEALPPPSPAVGGEDPRRTPSEEHRPAGPQAAARPVGKTPMPPPGSGPKRDGKPGGKSGPKPFVVKPNIGKPLTIKPELARPAPAEPAKPAAKPKSKSTPAADKKAAAKKASSSKRAAKPAASGKASKAKPAKPAKPAKRAADSTKSKAPAGKPRPPRSSTKQLTKRKPK